VEEAAGITTTQGVAAAPTMALAARGDGPLAAVGGGARANVANSGWGYGGVALSSYLNPSAMRAFMGGGGGGGHQNNDQGGQGGKGGGIVLIRAATIAGNGFQIIAAGDSGRRDPAICGGRTYAGNDGAGGGGGGGSVLLLCNTYAGTLTIDVQGGRGGNCSNRFCACQTRPRPRRRGWRGLCGFLHSDRACRDHLPHQRRSQRHRTHTRG
jgi:hypothetical protein